MLVRFVLLAFLIPSMFACGGSRGGGRTTPGGKRGIVAAALPYSIVDGRTGRQVDTQAFWSQLGEARVVCVGEDHPNPHHHWFQLEVMSQMAARKPDRKLALGMEMFQRPYQGVLDDYAAKRIDEAAMLSRSGYADRWGYDYGFYGPTIDKAVAAGAALLALLAPRELTKKVVRQGLASLTPDEKAQVPELVLDDKAHRSWFDGIMNDLGGASHGRPSAEGAKDAEAAQPSEGAKSAEPAKPGEGAKAGEGAKPGDKPGEAPGTSGGKPKMPSADDVYAVQVLWDESMADGAAKWLAATPGGFVVLIAGNGHCHDSAIVNRIKRRGVAAAVSVRPVLDVGGNVAEALAKPMNDYVVVLQLPPDVKKQMEAAENE